MTDRITMHRPLFPYSTRWQPADDPASPSAFTQGALALTYPLPDGLEATPRTNPLSLVARERADRNVAAPDVPGSTAPDSHLRARAGIPDPEQWAARFMQAVVEVLGSDRPLTQLVRWTDARVYDDLGRRRNELSRHRRPGQARVGRQHVATVHVRRGTVDSAEVAARVTLGSRSRAVAARLDFRRGRWLCTALTFG
jgi:hypothetical protein